MNPALAKPDDLNDSLEKNQLSPTAEELIKQTWENVDSRLTGPLAMVMNILWIQWKVRDPSWLVIDLAKRRLKIAQLLNQDWDTAAPAANDSKFNVESSQIEVTKKAA